MSLISLIYCLYFLLSLFLQSTLSHLSLSISLCHVFWKAWFKLLFLWNRHLLSFSKNHYTKKYQRSRQIPITTSKIVIFQPFCCPLRSLNWCYFFTWSNRGCVWPDLSLASYCELRHGWKLPSRFSSLSASPTDLSSQWPASTSSRTIASSMLHEETYSTLPHWRS